MKPSLLAPAGPGRCPPGCRPDDAAARGLWLCLAGGRHHCGPSTLADWRRLEAGNNSQGYQVKSEISKIFLN